MQKHLVVAIGSILLASANTWAANAFKVLYSFKFNATDGEHPTGSPALVGHVLYGLTSQGGANNDGTVFQFNLSTNQETATQPFSGATTDGKSPYGSLAISGATNFYGLTNLGGSANLGTVFQYNSTTGGETPVYSFAGFPNDGEDPVGSPLVSGNVLYGTTAGGETSSGGTIFQYNTSGKPNPFCTHLPAAHQLATSHTALPSSPTTFSTA